MAFFAVCTRCGAKRQVRRHEVLHATQPHCHRCGAALELSDKAKADLAKVQAAQAGDRPGAAAPTDEEPPLRLLPHKETTRYEFWEHPDMYRWTIKDQERLGNVDAVKAFKAQGPVKFYEGVLDHVMEHSKDEDGFAGEMVHRVEGALYESGRPYYKVWPSIATALCHTEMRVDGEFFRLPYQGIEIRFPKRDNVMEPACAVVAAKLEGRMWSDGRDWWLAIVFFDNVPHFHDHDDLAEAISVGNYWVADMPIRAGQSLEDSLDQTSLMRETPDPGMVRRIMRVVVGTAFFGVDKHEVILPEIRRSTIEYYRQTARTPTPSEAKAALADAKRLGMFGWKVGSEIDLPTKIVNHHAPDDGRPKEKHELTAGYVRRGHMRMQPHGEGSKQRKLIFVAPTVVRPDLPLGSQHGYRVRLT